MLSPTVVFVVLVLADASNGYTYCTSAGSTFSCSNGCCGDNGYQYCCYGTRDTETAMIALILGIVCSVVLTIVVIVALIICCVRCCCRSPKAHQGQIVTTGQPLTVITTGPNTTPGVYNAGYAYPPQPAPGMPYTQPAGTAQPPPS